ncbi:hypothetical protein ACJX0J_001557, partial (mitochondrion) [Zea mays]
DANLYFLAWLYFIDRGVSGRASAFNQTGTGQDEKQIGWVRITFMENQEWLPGKRYYLWHAIEDNGNDPFTQFVRNIEFTLSFLQPILWNLFFQHMSSLE